MEKIRLYGLQNCDSCKKAIKHLKEVGLEYEFIDIRENPPSDSEIHLAIKNGVERKRLLNTSGKLYRSNSYKENLPKMNDVEFSKTLASNSMLIKRPFLISKSTYLTGYKDVEYDALG